MVTNKIHNKLAISFSILLLLCILVCAICDMAISGTFTWSLYPISSILFVWLVFVPLVKSGNNSVPWSLTNFSFLLIPFLYVISEISCNNLVLPIGVRISLAYIVYLWCDYVIFRMLKARKILAAALSLILIIPLCVVINLILSKILSISLFDIWDILSCAVIIVIAIALFITDFKKHGKCSMS